jgi:RNA polymerase sigma-70 factor, ECF subfamily
VDDRQAFDLMKSADQAGLELLIKNYGSSVFSVVNYILGFNYNELYECIDDVWFDVWQQANKFDEHISSAKTWICMIARLKAIGYLRKEISYNRRFARYQVLDHQRILNELADIPEFLENKEELQQRSSLLRKIVRIIPDEDRDLIIRRYYYLEPIKQIARSRGVSRAVIDNQLSRTRKLLRSIYLEMKAHEENTCEKNK